MLTDNQAKVFRKLYVKTVNQDHIEKWAKGLEAKDASPIIGRIIKLNYAMATSRPGQFTQLQTWGRDEIKKLGYEEPQFNKSI